MMVNKKTIIFVGVLFVSLSLNMFLGGAWLGTRYHAAPESETVLRQKFSAEDQAVIHDQMKQQKNTFASLRRSLMDTQKKIQEAVEANDSLALDQALKEEKEHKTAILKMIQDSRLAAMKKMSAEGQAALKKIIEANKTRVRLWQDVSGQDFDLPPDLGGPDDPDMP